MIDSKGNSINWKKILKRTGFILSLWSAGGNFIYALREGVYYSWLNLSGGFFLQKKLAFFMVKMNMGECPDLLFVAIHSFFVFIIAMMIFYCLTASIVWICAGVKITQR